MGESEQGSFDYHLTKLTHLLSAKCPLIIINHPLSHHNERFIDTLQSTHFPHNQHTIRIIGNDSLKPQQLLQELYAQTNGKTPNIRLRFEDQLQALVTILHEKKINLILMISQAQELNYSIFAVISYLALLQEQIAPQLQILLVGDEKLNKKIKSIQTRTIPTVNLCYPQSTTSPLSANTTATIPKTTSEDRVLPTAPTHHINRPLTTANTSSLQMYWIQHQVKTIALCGIAFLVTGLWYFNNHTIAHSTLHSPLLSPTALTANNTLLQSRLSKDSPIFYRIQLLSGPNKKTIQQFAQNHKLPLATTVSHSHNQYALQMGKFNSYHLALQELNHLPKNLKRYHPWITTAHA